MQHRLPYKPSNRVRTNYKTLNGKKKSCGKNCGRSPDSSHMLATLFVKLICDCAGGGVDGCLLFPVTKGRFFIVLYYHFIHSSFWTAVTHCEPVDASVFNTTRMWKEGSEARTASSLSLARVRPSAITNGTNKHSSTTGSSSSSTSSSHSKTQRSASTYHRQRRHSDFCESLFWPLHFISDFPFHKHFQELLGFIWWFAVVKNLFLMIFF